MNYRSQIAGIIVTLMVTTAALAVVYLEQSPPRPLLPPRPPLALLEEPPLPQIGRLGELADDNVRYRGGIERLRKDYFLFYLKERLKQRKSVDI